MSMIFQKDKNFSKLLNRMSKAGGQAALAAENAIGIIKMIHEKRASNISDACRQTRHGEKRLKNCLKFNLGNGYRLITVKKNDLIRLVHIGTHDECDAWLEKYRGWDFFSITDDKIFSNLLSESAEKTPEKIESECFERDEYEERLMHKINDNTLCYLFCGLRKNGGI